MKDNKNTFCTYKKKGYPLKKLFLAPLILVSILTTPAFAEGFYLGTEINARGASLEINNRSVEDKTGVGWGIHAGYQFSPYFATEVAYRDLGDIDFTVAQTQSKASAIQASLIGTYPFTSRFSVFGRLGVAQLKSTLKDNRYTYQDHNDTKALLGLGVEFAITKQISLRTELSEYTGDHNISSLSLGANFKF
ncbi:outer membrane beta-barrel protein [Iodobacter sp. HSC-16F04]|uniref:Outer membrane beta-barrel protein n=1 Tax=Iodobacter violaceini TaxID=3044271 RepID=A0ABX0KNR3_9NEIS|nr:outer membrane beta-barrel protein [Iodobacter violacea]NHQ86078.1 outer membrane beta-barrel protein [Iodobacter violacea]